MIDSRRSANGVLGVLLDRPALLATPYAGQLEGLLTSPELRAVFAAAAAAVQESGALDLTALFSALDDSRALPWLKERLDRADVSSQRRSRTVAQSGLPLLEKRARNRSIR